MWNLDDLEPQMRTELEQEFREAACMQAVKSELRQLQVAKLYHATKPRSIKDLGPQIAVLDPTFYHYFTGIEGRSFLDKDWVKWILNRHDCLKVNSGGTKIMSGWTRATEGASFHKSYATA